jgi:hypothetical protein
LLQDIFSAVLLYPVVLTGIIMDILT